MNWKTQRHLSEEAFLIATFSEFVKCWGSGKRARIFVESMNGGAFVNFSTFLGNPGSEHINRRKMAAKTNGHPEGHHDTQHNPHSGSAQTSLRKKSKRKTERDNKRAAEFQKKKAEEAEREASAAPAGPTEEEEAKATKEEVAETAKDQVAETDKDALDDDENTADENIAQTANDARVSVVNVADKTLGDNLHSMRNVSKFSFHAVLNVDGNESIQDLDDLNQGFSNSLANEQSANTLYEVDNETKTKVETHDIPAHRIPDPPPQPQPWKPSSSAINTRINFEELEGLSNDLSRRERIQRIAQEFLTRGLPGGYLTHHHYLNLEDLRVWRDFLAGLNPEWFDENYENFGPRIQIRILELESEVSLNIDGNKSLQNLEDPSEENNVSSPQTHRRKKKKRKSRF